MQNVISSGCGARLSLNGLCLTVELLSIIFGQELRVDNLAAVDHYLYVIATLIGRQ